MYPASDDVYALHRLCRQAGGITEQHVSMNASGLLAQDLLARDPRDVLCGHRVQTRQRRPIVHLGLSWIDESVVRIACCHWNATSRIGLMHYGEPRIFVC